MKPTRGLPNLALKTLRLAQARRRGFSLASVNTFIAWFRESDVGRASLAVAPRNAAAIALYRSTAFEPATLVMEIRHDCGSPE
jgi:RimJ/RimL family protein N-acetyltransferase